MYLVSRSSLLLVGKYFTMCICLIQIIITAFVNEFSGNDFEANALPLIKQFLYNSEAEVLFGDSIASDLKATHKRVIIEKMQVMKVIGYMLLVLFRVCSPIVSRCFQCNADPLRSFARCGMK